MRLRCRMRVPPSDGCAPRPGRGVRRARRGGGGRERRQPERGGLEPPGGAGRGGGAPSRQAPEQAVWEGRCVRRVSAYPARRGRTRLMSRWSVARMGSRGLGDQNLLEMQAGRDNASVSSPPPQRALAVRHGRVSLILHTIHKYNTRRCRCIRFGGASEARRSCHCVLRRTVVLRRQQGAYKPRSRKGRSNESPSALARSFIHYFFMLRQARSLILAHHNLRRVHVCRV